MGKYDHAEAFAHEPPTLKAVGNMHDLLGQVCVGVDLAAAGADSWLLELDVDGWEVLVWPLEGHGAPYRMEVRQRGHAEPAKCYHRAKTMEAALEAATAAIEAETRKPVDRARLLTIARGFDDPASS
jgi:hypothetical protein